MPFNVALTGGIGSGKSTVAKIFSTMGINIIDADVIAREVVKPGRIALQEIVRRYGKSILTIEGMLHRAKLREIIFQQSKEKDWINNLIHPLINERTQYLKILATSPYVIWVAPLLIENELQHFADRVLVVDVNEMTQLRRTEKRDKIPYSQVKKILSAQASRKERLACADDIINNNYPLEKILPRIFELHNFYLRLAMSVPD